MARIKPMVLKAGQSITGAVVNTSTGIVRLASRDSETIYRVKVPDEIVEAIEDEIGIEDVLTIAVSEDGEFLITNYEREWPKEEETSDKENAE